MAIICKGFILCTFKQPWLFSKFEQERTYILLRIQPQDSKNKKLKWIYRGKPLSRNARLFSPKNMEAKILKFDFAMLKLCFRYILRELIFRQPSDVYLQTPKIIENCGWSRSWFFSCHLTHRIWIFIGVRRHQR